MINFFSKIKRRIFCPVAILHVDTLKREYTSTWLLAKTLNTMGYRAIICSRLSTSLLLKVYAPDVVVLSHTFSIPTSQRDRLIEKGVRVYVSIVEECVDDTTYMEIMYRPELNVENFSGIFVWSKWAKAWLLKNTKISEVHVHTVGSIRNSVLARTPRNTKDITNKTIGLIGQFQSLNTWDRRHPFVDLMDTDAEDLTNGDTRYCFEKKPMDAEVFALLMKILKKILEVGCKVLIRPHPNEDRDAYKLLVNRFGDQVEIDDSNDVCEWLSKVDVILGPASTSYTEAYIAKVPIVSLHKMQKYRFTSKEVFEPLDMLAMGAHLPNNCEEAATLCVNPHLKAKHDSKLDDYLDLAYSIKDHQDPVMDLVGIITKEISSLSGINKAMRPFGIALKWILDLLRIFQSITPLTTGTPLIIIKQYHFNSFLHKNNKFMKLIFTKHPIKFFSESEKKAL